MLTSLLIIPGLYFLVKGADLFVDGASSIAKKFKISPLVIGLTIVAFGTSLPELIVSTTSAFSGNTDIALGNVIGSNIGNILLILGISATISKISVKSSTVWKEIPFSLLASIMVLLFAVQQFLDQSAILKLLENVNNYLYLNQNTKIGEIGITYGLILLFLFVIFIYYNFGIAKNTDSSEDDVEIKNLSTKKSVFYVLGGLAILVVAGNITVDGAVNIAKLFNVSEALIGLTIVAIGTSLPELVTSVVAATKKQSDIAIGNVIGSNIFNIFFILGITATLRPIPIFASSLIYIIVLVIATVYTFVSLFILEKHKIGRIEGISLIVLYILYVGFLISKG